MVSESAEAERSVAVGDELVLDVTTVAHGGVFIARLAGRVVFVSDTAPGERVRARVVEGSKRSFLRAETVEVLEASPHRRPQVWPEAGHERAGLARAGGAEFGHLELSYQRSLKEAVVADALRRLGGLDEAQSRVRVEALPGDDEAGGLGWRTRVRLHVDEEGRVGPYSARSRRVVPVGSLPLASEAVRAAAPLTARLPGALWVDVVAPSEGEALVLRRDGGPAAGRGEAQPDAVIVERVGGRAFRVSAGGFWQVHRQAAQTLSGAVRAAVDPERLDPAAANLDLYGGVGLLGAALGELGGPGTRLTSVESDARATELAGENLAEWVGSRAVSARVDRFLAQLERTASAAERERLARATVVLDPPRAGAGRDVMDALGRLGPAQIVYVACDPAAFARDLAYLAEHGYRPETIRGFDLFPHTHHVELVARLGR